MGTNIKDLTDPKPISLVDLKGKVLAVDSFNMFFQFLTSIRQRDGTPLKDPHGNITSVLVGLQSRIPPLLQKGLKFIFVVDGKPPALKEKERDRRRGLKEIASIKYDKAKAEEDTESMRKFASMKASLTPSIVEDALKLLNSYGIPIVHAPSEGEAQAQPSRKLRGRERRRALEMVRGRELHQAPL